MDRKNIGAYTTPGVSMPSFISINVEADGTVGVHVRSANDAGQAVIYMTADDAKRIFADAAGALA